MMRVDQGKENEAIACFDEALAWQPSFVDARRSRAVLLARQGRLDEAQEEINRCLGQGTPPGITLYAAACVLALGAEKNPDTGVRRQLQDQAVAFLARAFEQGYGRATASFSCPRNRSATPTSLACCTT
jgi:hypothetical protein